MEKLKQMLEAYRNKERDFPSYSELMALALEPASTGLTEKQIAAGGRWLCDQSSVACGVDREDNWKIYGSEYVEEFRGALAAAEKAV